jgi:hypothetical protein
MEGHASLLYLAAMLSPLVALFGAVFVYLRYRHTPERKRRSVVLFSVGTLLVGLIVGWVGAAIGIGVFCSSNAGAQCGFGGVFFTGPLSFSLAVAIFLYFWAKRGKAL